MYAKGKRNSAMKVMSTRCTHPRSTQYRMIADRLREDASDRGDIAAAADDVRATRTTVGSSPVILHPPVAQPQLQQRQREHDYEKNPRHRARIAHAEELERLLEQVVGEEEGGIERRPTVRHDE